MDGFYSIKVFQISTFALVFHKDTKFNADM